MTKSLALCDRVDHVRDALAASPAPGIVALTPECAWFCQQHGVPYLRLDDFYSDAEVNAFAEVTLRRQYAWARWVDAALAQAVPEFGANAFTPARVHLCLLKRCLDSIIRPARLLLDFVAAAQPDRIIVFEREPLCPTVMSVPDGPVRPLFAWLAPTIIGRRVKVEVWPEATTEPLQAQAIPCPPPRGLGRLAHWIRQRPIGPLDQVALSARNLLARRARVAWVGSSGYDLAFAIPTLQRLGVAVMRPDSLTASGRVDQAEIARLKRLLASRWRDVCAAPEFWQPFDEVSLALRGPIEPFLRQWLLQDVPLMWAAFLSARRWLRRSRCTAVIGVEILPGFSSAVFMAANALGIPRILAIHNGGLIMDIPVQDCLGPIQSDVYLVYSQAEVDYCDSFQERLGTFPRARVVPAESARLEALRASGKRRSRALLRARLKAGNPAPLLLYVPTQFRSYHRYFGEGNTSDVAYFELQERILKCCAEFPEIQVLYKPFPSEYAVSPMESFLARFVPNGRVIWTPLVDLIWAVDAIIIDFPSTALTEAALTDKPLLVYAGKDWARLLPRAKTALEQRAWVSETPEEFEAQVRQFLSAGKFAPVADPNGEFLRLIGVDGSATRSAERAAEVIAQIALTGRLPEAATQPVGHGTPDTDIAAIPDFQTVE